MRAREFVAEITISGPDPRVKSYIDRVYAKFPNTWQNNHVMSWGTGDEQQLAMFELVPSLSKKGAAEIKWFQAYPLRSGVGSRAMQILQQMAQEDGVALTLYPWDRGQVSQAKLIKFYRQQGFRPAQKGSKNLVWEPTVGITESLDQPYELIDWDEDSYEDEVSTWAALPDGTYLEIDFERNEESWHVEFRRDRNAGKTGQGDAQRIFATVLLAIKQFIKKYDPDEINFSSIKHQDETGSRESLYNALVKKYAAGLGYSLNVKDDSYHRYYLLNKIQQGVTESLNQPYNLIDWDQVDFGEPLKTWAALPDGTNLEINFNKESPLYNDWDVDFYRGGTIKKTGQGDQQRIFATVLSAIQQFINNQQPNEIRFSAIKHEDETGSRQKLYTALAKKYAASLGYALSTKDDAYHQHYIFKKIKKDVAEGKLVK